MLDVEREAHRAGQSGYGTGHLERSGTQLSNWWQEHHQSP
jgi:hypothetical protein